MIGRELRLLKIATLPVQTLVALMKISTSVQARTRSKSMSASIASRKGLMLSGFVRRD